MDLISRFSFSLSFCCDGGGDGGGRRCRNGQLLNAQIGGAPGTIAPFRPFRLTFHRFRPIHSTALNFPYHALVKHFGKFNSFPIDFNLKSSAAAASLARRPSPFHFTLNWFELILGEIGIQCVWDWWIYVGVVGGLMRRGNAASPRDRREKKAKKWESRGGRPGVCGATFRD